MFIIICIGPFHRSSFCHPSRKGGWADLLGKENQSDGKEHWIWPIENEIKRSTPNGVNVMLVPLFCLISTPDSLPGWEKEENLEKKSGFLWWTVLFGVFGCGPLYHCCSIYLSFYLCTVPLCYCAPALALGANKTLSSCNLCGDYALKILTVPGVAGSWQGTFAVYLGVGFSCPLVIRNISTCFCIKSMCFINSWEMSS